MAIPTQAEILAAAAVSTAALMDLLLGTATTNTPDCVNMRRCDNCSGACRDCVGCQYAVSCVNCTNVDHSSRCRGCENLKTCYDCQNCKWSKSSAAKGEKMWQCEDCRDCERCVMVKGGKNLRNTVLNRQLSNGEFNTVWAALTAAGGING